MNSLRIRLTLWFALSFLAVSAVFSLFTYRHLDLELRRKTFQREENINPNWILHGSYAELEVKGIMAELVFASLTYSLPLLLVTLVVGYVIAKKSLGPIDRLNQQLRRISPRTLQQRVELEEGDEEFRDLVKHLNEMLGRLEASFGEMSNYAAKVAHELRTPLTILRLKVEQSDSRIAPELAEELQGELHRLWHVVEQSLLIAKADQKRVRWQPILFDLSGMLSSLVDDFHLLAGEEGRAIVHQIQPACYIQTDPQYSKQILHALLTNALSHGLGDIRIRLRASDRSVRLLLVNRVRSKASASELTLGLGLRVVRALLGMDPWIQFHQHSGSRLYVTRIVFPKAVATTLCEAGSEQPSSPRQSLAEGPRVVV